MTTHIVIDLETLDTKQTAKITAIGAVAFEYDIEEANALEPKKFIRLLKHDDQYGRTVSAGTMNFWAKQDEKVRKTMIESGTTSLQEALEELSSFVLSLPGCRVWGNGPTFDVSILENAYDMCEMPYPWEFWNIRDVRTLKEVTECVTGKRIHDAVPRPEELVLHNALHDAAYEAVVIEWCMSTLGVQF